MEEENREIEHIQGESSILTELLMGINVFKERRRACRTLKKKCMINKDETVKQKMQLKA